MSSHRFFRISLATAAMGSVVLLGACSSSKTTDTTVAGTDTTAVGAATDTTVAKPAADTTIAGSGTSVVSSS